MGNLQLFKPFKSKSYQFIDKIVSRALNVSGTTFLVHLYIGPNQQDTDDITNKVGRDATETTIQDVLLLENRDRKYEKNVIDLKGSYTVNDLEFNLTQFGILQSAGTLFINFHINQMIERLGRKLIPGDVLEVIHRKDEVVLDPTVPFIPAFYVIQDTAKAAEGYSPTWWPHLWRVRAEQLTDSQEYKQIMNTVVKKGFSIEDLISTYNKNEEISNRIQEEGDIEIPTKNFNGDNLFVQNPGMNLGTTNLIDWQFNNDGTPPNMNDIAPSGTRFPDNPVSGDYYLRLDYQPHRLFQRNQDNTKWVAIQNVWRDRSWSPAHRSLEDQTKHGPEIIFSENPLDQRNERQPTSDPIQPQQILPQYPNELTPEENRIQNENNGD